MVDMNPKGHRNYPGIVSEEHKKTGGVLAHYNTAKAYGEGALKFYRGYADKGVRARATQNTAMDSGEAREKQTIFVYLSGNTRDHGLWLRWQFAQGSAGWSCPECQWRTGHWRSDARQV